MERWKSFFQSSGVDLWTVCERALTVAYIDDPDDFPFRRDKLAQKLFAPEKFDLQAWKKDAPPTTGFDSPSGDETKGAYGQDPYKDEVSSEDGDSPLVANGAYDEAEVLTEEMEEERLAKRSVLTIKDILQDSEQSEKEILDSLQRLDLMQLSVDVLKDTEVGKTVNSLRKHSSKRVRSTAKRLVSGWKELVEEWVKSAQDVAAAAMSGTPASRSPDDINEEHGLPSPPMDEGALLTTRTASVEMSQLFDFMNDDIPARPGGQNTPENNHSQPAVVDPKTLCENIDNLPELRTVSKPSERRRSFAGRERIARMDLESKELKEQGVVNTLNGYFEKEIDHSIRNGCNGINGRTNTLPIEKLHRDRIEKKSDFGHNQMTNTLTSGSSLAHSDDPDYDERIQASKRKLQKNYQQAENAKKQRTIRVMDLQDLPKGGPNRVKPSYNSKPSSQQQPWATGRK